MVGCASTNHTHRNPAEDERGVSPRLFIQPAPVFDGECSQKTGFQIDPNWYAELWQKAGSFQSEWDQKAKPLIETSEKAAGRKFSRTEYSVALTLCKWTPMGHPLIISVRPYLEGPAKADEKIKKPMSMTSFVSMMHHELLHSLVDNILNQDFSNSSAMLIKYQGEPMNVLVHLHLMAIQKASYVESGEKDLLKKTEQLYLFIGGDYKRAWDIIALEGTEKFLSELKIYNGAYK